MRQTDNAGERRPLLLGQWLVAAELAEVVIIAIVFRFIKPLCRCLTLGISRNDGAACVRC